MNSLLITGDDGYKALGIRLLSRIFRDNYQITVVASKAQKSGVGGGLQADGSKEWGYEMIDGIDSYWVDGTPADSMEFAQGKFPKGFDYLISGINWGENVGLSLVTASGTGGAAIRALGLGVAPRVITMSWMKVLTEEVASNWYKRETAEESIDDYIQYPGGAARTVFNEIVKNEFWGKRIVNVNFPKSPTSEYKLTKLVDNLAKLYLYPVIIKDNTYSYEEQVYSYSEETKNDTSVDVGALLSGFISVSPFDIG